MVNIVLKFSGKIKQKVIEYFGEESVTVQDDGNLIVKFTYPEDDYIYSIILSFEEYFEVLEPANIKSKLKEKVEKILSYYKL
ncbi:MAG: WYL domain-containing protein [Ignavibacteriae bacterium]|nr:WYL domain-containing protein [Ignavibacteriota bacterium]